MSLPPEQSPDDTEIAAEYVLRVLPADAHRTAAIRAASEPAFAAEVRAWESRFAPMMDEVAAVRPDPALKTDLMERLFGHVENDVQGTRAVIWQALAALGFAAAAALAVIAFMPQDPIVTRDGPRFVAELANGDETTRMFAVYSPETGALNIAWTARATTEGRDMQLWGLVEGEDPVSIGVLPAGRTATLDLPDSLLMNTSGLVLAISDEPSGGSPTGLPTGEVFATAVVADL